MKGRVKVFFDSKGYGFITSDDNQDYFFHIVDFKTTDKPYIGMEVTFDIGHNAKGSVANNICAISTITKKSFIIIGDTRIKLSNIKMYRISKYSHSIMDGDGVQHQIVSDKILEIETFQGDCFSFSEYRGIDVEAKLAELDKYLCN